MCSINETLANTAVLMMLLMMGGIVSEKMKDLPFLYLTLDLPAAPLYRDELMQNIIPQVPLSVLLTKFNGAIEKVTSFADIISYFPMNFVFRLFVTACFGRVLLVVFRLFSSETEGIFCFPFRFAESYWGIKKC